MNQTTEVIIKNLFRQLTINGKIYREIGSGYDFRIETESCIVNLFCPKRFI